MEKKHSTKRGEAQRKGKRKGKRKGQHKRRKPPRVDYFRVPKPLWKRIKHLLPAAGEGMPTRTPGDWQPCGAERHLVRVVDRLPVEGAAAEHVWCLGQCGASTLPVVAPVGYLRADHGGNGAVLRQRTQSTLEIGKRPTARIAQAPLGGEEKPAAIPPTAANAAASFISWSTAAAHRWPSASRPPIATTSVRCKTWCSRWWSTDLMRNNTSVLTVAMITPTSGTFCTLNTMYRISNIAAAAANHTLILAPSPVRRSSQLGTGVFAAAWGCRTDNVTGTGGGACTGHAIGSKCRQPQHVQR